MTLSLGTALESLLVSAPDAQVRAALLQAGAPALWSALQEVLLTPEKILALESEEAAMLTLLVEDPVVLSRIQELDQRLGVQRSARSHRFASRTDVSLPPLERELFPPGSPTLQEAVSWSQVNFSRSVEFLQWLVTGSPDPRAFLAHYAGGNFGFRDHSIFHVLQYHEDVMTLEDFFQHIPTSKRPAFLQDLEEAEDEVGPALVCFILDHQGKLPLYSTYTPEARELLRGSVHQRSQAVFLLSAPDSEEPDVELYRSLPLELQAAVLFIPEGRPRHQNAYARHISFVVGASLEHDPSLVLRKKSLDFSARLNLMRWASPSEISKHLLEDDYTPEEMCEVLQQLFDGVPQLTSPEEWVEELNYQNPRLPRVQALAGYTVAHATGIVGSALGYVDDEGPCTTVIRSGLLQYCGTSISRWESVLSLAPDWDGTLSELLECVDLTESS